MSREKRILLLMPFLKQRLMQCTLALTTPNRQTPNEEIQRHQHTEHPSTPPPPPCRGTISLTTKQEKQHYVTSALIGHALSSHCVFDLIHSLSHPSGCSTAKLLKQKFVWHGISGDAKQWARACIPCQSSKVTRHTESGIGDFHTPCQRFGHINWDVVSPLPPSE